jgi:hypothetical protein
MVRHRLLGEDGEPMMYFFPNCVDAIRTLPAMQHDRDNPEDVDTDGEDHAPDEIRYACMSRPYTRGEMRSSKGQPKFTMTDGAIYIKDAVGDIPRQKNFRFAPYKRI